MPTVEKVTMVCISCRRETSRKRDRWIGLPCVWCGCEVVDTIDDHKDENIDSKLS